MEPASTGSTNGSVFVGASRLRAEVRRSPPPEVRPLPWREAERMGVGGYPQTPTKEGCALYGLSCRKGPGADSVGGFPQAPTKEGCALYGLSCQKGPGADSVGGFPQAPTKEGCALYGLSCRKGPGADSVGGFPQAPTKEGCALSGLSRRAGSSPRGSGCDVHQVHCFATRFGEINDQLIDSLLKQG